MTSRIPVGKRALAGSNALYKVSRHEFQRFGLVDEGAPDIAGTVIHHDPASRVCVRRHGDSAVINLDGDII